MADGVVDTITIPEILDRAEATIPTATAWTQANRAVADTYNVALIAYEGGQHLYGNNDTLTQKLIAANRDQRMYDLYRTYLDGWYANGGEMFVHYGYVKEYASYGSWGAMEYLDQPLSEAPKYRALRDVMSSGR